MGKHYSASEAAAFVSGFIESGMSRQEYAERCGISLSYLSKLLREAKEKEGSERFGGFVEVGSPASAEINRCHFVEIKLFNGTVIKVGGGL
jgi:DNA-binding CsgD family transcriptional regulator